MYIYVIMHIIYAGPMRGRVHMYSTYTVHVLPGAAHGDDRSAPGRAESAASRRRGQAEGPSPVARPPRLFPPLPSNPPREWPLSCLLLGQDTSRGNVHGVDPPYGPQGGPDQGTGPLRKALHDACLHRDRYPRAAFLAGSPDAPTPASCPTPLGSFFASLD